MSRLALRPHQQELIASFGLIALSTPGLQPVLNEASAVAAEGLQSRMAKVLRYRPDKGDFLVASGVGWRDGVVGHATLPAGPDSPAGYAVLSNEPVLASALWNETRFQIPSLLAEHAVQSAINVVIRSPNNGVFGVLEVDSTHPTDFAPGDTAFLQALADMLAAAIARANAEDEVLREKDLLMQEAHHRIKNSLQLVHMMLQQQARTAHPETRRHLEEAARRIMTVSAVHHRLYSGATEKADGREFIRALLADMEEVLSEQGKAREITLEAPPLEFAAESVTSLGIVVTELVTNAGKYGKAPIAVLVSETEERLRVTVEDSGPGFPPGFDPAGATGLGMRLIGALSNLGPSAISVDRSVPFGRISVLLRR